ncbi:MAG: hypothetical protein M3347_06165, partial [Armatimonadota bacterium]|nr:hypothetical protein [Armatimonadota bacterium]
TFKFARNFWYCLDAPARSRPTLPTPEEGGIYGQDPLFRDAEKGDIHLQPNSPAQKMGADALPKEAPLKEAPIKEAPPPPMEIL